jgi:hypothetical protein
MVNNIRQQLLRQASSIETSNLDIEISTFLETDRSRSDIALANHRFAKQLVRCFTNAPDDQSSLKKTLDEMLTISTTDKMHNVGLIENAIRHLQSSIAYYQEIYWNAKVDAASKVLADLHEILADLYFDMANTNSDPLSTLIYLNTARIQYDSSVKCWKTLNMIPDMQLYLSIANVYYQLTLQHTTYAQEYAREILGYMRENVTRQYLASIKEDISKDEYDDLYSQYQQYVDTFTRLLAKRSRVAVDLDERPDPAKRSRKDSYNPSVFSHPQNDRPDPRLFDDAPIVSSAIGVSASK